MCLVLSFSIWLIHNLSQYYVEVVNVPVLAYSNLDGRSQQASEEITVAARCKTRGSRIISLRRGKHATKVFFKADDLEHVNGDTYSLSENVLNRYSQDIFGDDVTVETFLSPSVQVKFAEESHRKVPVRAVSVTSFKPQYMARGDIKLSPDSVVVYADPSRLETIDAVYTRAISLNDLSKSARGVAKLEKLHGVRVSDSECTYSLDVVRFVELSAEVAISARNVPSGSEFSYFPNKCKATFRCVFPMSSIPSDRVEFYVDYREFLHSRTGRCVIHCDGLDAQVIDYSLDPEVCDCLERSL